MKDKKKSEKVIKDQYEAERKSLISRMESGDEEQKNIKIKMATYVIYELSHTTPSWFKNYFLSSISKNNGKADDSKSERILIAENEFFNRIGDYLINMESEVEYVKEILSPLTEEWDKKDFWRPIVADAFLLADLYFASQMEFNGDDSRQPEQIRANITPTYLFQILRENAAALI